MSLTRPRFRTIEWFVRKQDIGIDVQITARMVVPREIKGGAALEGLPPFSMRKLKDTQIINDLTSLKTSL
jgi:hypothetical protein